MMTLELSPTPGLMTGTEIDPVTGLFIGLDPGFNTGPGTATLPMPEAGYDDDDEDDDVFDGGDDDDSEATFDEFDDFDEGSSDDDDKEADDEEDL